MYILYIYHCNIILRMVDVLLLRMYKIVRSVLLSLILRRANEIMFYEPKWKIKSYTFSIYEPIYAHIQHYLSLHIRISASVTRDTYSLNNLSSYQSGKSLGITSVSSESSTFSSSTIDLKCSSTVDVWTAIQ